MFKLKPKNIISDLFSDRPMIVYKIVMQIQWLPLLYKPSYIFI